MIGYRSIGALIVVVLAFLWFRHEMSQSYEAGRAFERQEAIKRADELNKQREKDLEELSHLPVDNLRCELRGRVLRNGKCE